MFILGIHRYGLEPLWFEACIIDKGHYNSGLGLLTYTTTLWGLILPPQFGACIINILVWFEFCIVGICHYTLVVDIGHYSLGLDFSTYPYGLGLVLWV